MSSKIVFNGKEYESVEGMPREVRAAYEKALAAHPSLKATGATPTVSLTKGVGSGAPPPERPAAGSPADAAARARRMKYLQVGIWVVVAVVVIVWLLLR
jgi:hypothetical protein